MRGDFCHNEVLTKRLRQAAEACDAMVQTEAPICIEGNTCYGDLLIRKEVRIILCELEDSCRRVENDWRKAIAFGAGILLIATPDAPTAHACRRRLRQCAKWNASLKVIICPLGAAIEILRQILTTDGPKRKENEP